MRPFFHFLLGRRAIGPQLLKRDGGERVGEGLEVRRQPGKTGGALEAALIHIKRPVELQLDRVQPGSGIAIMLGDEATGIRLVAADRVTKPAQGVFHGFRDRSDAGGAVGAALTAWHKFNGQPRSTSGSQDTMQGSLLGPSYTNEQIEQFLRSKEAPYQRLDDEAFFDRVAEELADGKVVGWFQGRMEFGPRALGSRSILGDARNPKMQSVMNLKIKFRESFRPFAPSVLRERVSDYFALDTDSPYMLLVAPVVESRRTSLTKEQESLWGIDLLNVPKSDIPAATHVDYSARIQTVHEDTNPRYYRLLKAFEGKTGCGLLVNTSFNVRSEPIVCTPEDAYRCFMRTAIDILVLENCLLYKADQKALVGDTDWQQEFELD